MGGTTLGSNWGENNHAATSTAACIPYYPVVWLKGGTGVLMRITQLRGQGIMLIDTNVQIQGGFNFTGLILVRQGRLQISGTSTNPTKITGAIMSASTTPNKASVALSGTADVAYSSCAIAQALAQTLSRPVPAPGRAWAEMF
jgi:hypothetical protein